MSPFTSMLTEEVYIMSPDGAQQGPFKTAIGKGSATIFDKTIDVEEGYKLVKPLPNGKNEIYTITETKFNPNFHSIPAHYALKVRKDSSLVERSPMTKSTTVNMTDELTLFISHSARDAEIAKSLVTLFEKAFKISARRIRCTSVDGYRLPAGADTNEVLRTEVFGAKLFVALLTPNSLSSPYVLFELGARWGTRRPLYPLLAGGVTPAQLSAPLNGLNALSMISANQVRQLLENASEALSQPLEPASSFSAEVEGVVEVASVPSSNSTVVAENQAAEPSTDNLEDEQVKILLELAKQEWSYAEQIARAVGIGIQVVQYHLDELQNEGMVAASYSMGGTTEWCLDHGGRKFLIKKRLIS